MNNFYREQKLEMTFGYYKYYEFSLCIFRKQTSIIIVSKSLVPDTHKNEAGCDLEINPLIWIAGVQCRSRTSEHRRVNTGYMAH